MNTKKLTLHQQRVVLTEGVAFLGWDENRRPVVEKRRMFSDHTDRWALTLLGDPAEVKGQISAEPPQKEKAR